MEPPADLLMELLPYQKEFLGWAVRQEQGHIKGGILADEMGMGKTIQVTAPSKQHLHSACLSALSYITHTTCTIFKSIYIVASNMQ